MASLQYFHLFLLCLLLLFSPVHSIEAIPQAADADTIVKADSSKTIRLDANLLIPDGGELLLSIQVPREPIKLLPKGPAKVVRVYSNHVDGKFGVGEVVNIFVQFTSPVKVSGAGTPYLILKTGCQSSSCHVKEMQRLRCQATKGKFALGFGSQKVGNIPWDATTKVFAGYVRRMNRIDKVSVKYSIDENRACTFFGNNITITFDSMNIAGTDGDLVEMTGDATNAAGDGVVLEHIMYSPMVSAKAWEIRKGVLVPDRKASFVAQTAPDTLNFAYTVQSGDNTTKLDYANSDSLALSLRAVGGVRILNDDGSNTLANTVLPPPGFAGDWERGLGTSLSKNSALEIDVTPPFVKTVTSPHEDGTFGIGEEILVHVTFSQPIVVTGLLTVVLETGAVDRIIPFNQVVGNIAEFKYIVQSMDTSPDLTYTGTTALQLNGGSIKRKSTTPTTDAILKLPVNGESGSLSVNKNIVIDTSNPKVLTVTTTAKDGIYTAGDEIPVVVTFDTPVVVTGTPQLLLSTGSVDLFPGQFVQAAPTPLSSKTIIFPSVNYALSTGVSKGLQFLIGGQILTVDTVSGDEVTMLETYTGTLVDPKNVVNRAQVPVFTPGFRPAKYSSGSGTMVLIFTYVVQNGDFTSWLDYISTSALVVGSGSIKRLSTTPFTDADLTLGTPGEAKSLGISSKIVINTDAPRVLQVKTITRDGVYKASDKIFFELVFDLPVVVYLAASVLTNVPTVAIERLAVYSAGSGSSSLQFKFECLEDDQVAVFDYLGTDALRASYGSITGWIRRKSMAPLLPAVMNLPVAGISSKGISIKQSCEVVLDVSSSHEEGTYGVGESIDFLVQYSANVNVDTTGGTPTLITTTGNRAVYQSGTGTKVLVFTYIVEAMDSSGPLTYPDTFSLNPNGAVIKGSTSAALSSTLLPPPDKSQLTLNGDLFVRTSPPVVLDVATRTQDQVITIGDTIVVSASFDVAVDVPAQSVGTGVPTLLLNVGTGTGTSSTFVAVDDNTLYFSLTVAAGQSTNTLAYFGRTALKCGEGKGLNKDPAQNAASPTAVLFDGRLFTSWAEIQPASTIRHIRVKSFAVQQQFPPLSSFEDGGAVASIVNFASGMDANDPRLVVFSSKLYLLWTEASTTTTNPTQIRVAMLSSRSTPLSPAQWTFVDTKPASAVGINKATTENAGTPHAIVHNSKLYAAWHESASGVTQIRVAVYNGVDSTPAWTFVDGNLNVRGLNFAAAQSAQNVRLCSCASKGSVVKLLYAAWEETATGTGISQIRVAVQTATDAAPVWKFIDGNAASGLNIDVLKAAKAPSIQCVGSTNVVVGWHEATMGTGSIAIVKKFNADLAAPQWTRLDNGKGLNFDATQASQNVRIAVQLVAATEKLFATWEEVEVSTAATQIRVAKLSHAGTWKFQDGGRKLSALNDNSIRAASQPVLAMGSQETVYAVWQEIHSNGKTNIRSSALESSIKEWMPISQGCVLRKSTTSVTAANLLLPELNTPGSLDFGRSIRVETSTPKVENVSLSGDIDSSITSVNTIQTIDVFNVASITQGEYKLVYGELMETSCISWNAPATGIGSVESALESISGLALNVLVTKDSSAFHDGYRYTITFSFPSMGLQPLQVQSSPCKKFICSASSRFPCNVGLVQPNQNSDIRTAAGVVDILVRYSFPVVISTGIPKLTIDTGAVTRDALYTTRSALQEFDVGINLASPVLGGGFRLSYGDFSTGVGVGTIVTTDCIQLFQKDEDGVQELLSKLNALAVINTIGIRSLSRRKLRNGYRYSVEFRNSGDMLDLVSASSSICPAVRGTTQTIDISANLKILSGEIKVQLGDVKSGCIAWNVRAKGPTHSMEALVRNLESDRVIPLSVVKDPSAFVYGVKYYLNFMNMDDANKPLLAFQDAACAAFTCDNGNGVAVPCTGLSVTSNADFRVTRAASEVISFRYIVQASDEATSLTYKSTNSLTGSILRSSKTPTLAASLILPPAPVALWSEDRTISMSVVRSDKIPVVSRVYSSTLDDTYTAGDAIIVLVEFSEKVIVQGKPILELDSKGEAVYISGSNTNVLRFYYEVQPGDGSLDLNYASVNALRTFTVPISRVRCALCSGSGIDADTTLPSLNSAASLAGNKALVVDSTQPLVQKVSSSRPDTVAGGVGFGAGDIVDIIVTYSTEVSVVGVPSLSLNSGGTATFTYAGYRQLLDVGVNAIDPVTSGQFAVVYNNKMSGCIDLNDAASAAETSLKSRLLEFEAIARIGVVSVTMTKKKNGNRFEVVFDDSKVVDVPAAIELVVSDMCDPLQPSSAAQEALVARSTDTQVVFHYTVGAGESIAALNVVSSNIGLDGGAASILRRSGAPTIAASVVLPVFTGPQSFAQSKTLKIDGTPATIVDIVSDSAADSYGVGFPSVASPSSVSPGEILFHFVFSRPVSVVGTPTVELANGSLRPTGVVIPNRFAKYAGQPQTNQVAFLYHIEAEDYSDNLAFPSLSVLSDAKIYVVSSTMAVRATTILPRLTIVTPGNAVIKVDAYSVPATVKLASTHDDGVYGAGELIEIQVTFSKQIVLLSGLNRNQDWHAQYPAAIEFNGNIYIMWTERDKLKAPTKSNLFLRVFSSSTLEVVTLTSVSPINRVPNSFIEKVAMTVWKQNLYAAWDEGGLLFCAKFEGLTSINPWTLLPNMGINKNMGMAASDPVLLVYNLELVVIWREKALLEGSSALVRHIRVAVLNYDVEAPFWVFHDGNDPNSGLNKNYLMDADSPAAVVYRGRMYVSWTEMNANGAYEIVIARRNIQTRDFSTWSYLQALPSTFPAYSFLSARSPQFAVRRKGIEDMALVISWYRDTPTSNVSEIITGQVLDLDWEASVTGNIPQTINAAQRNTTFDKVNPNTVKQQFVTCGDNIYSSWLDLEGASVSSPSEGAYIVKLATLPTGADVYTGWTLAVNESNLNHNPKRDAIDSTLVCSTSSDAKPQVGLLWTEYDGYSIKLRFRHSSVMPRIPGTTSKTYGESVAGGPILMLATQSNPLGFAACIDKSGFTTMVLSFTYIVQPGESSPKLEIFGNDAMKLNGAVIRDVFGQDPDFTLFPDASNFRSLSFNNQLAIDTTAPTVSKVTSKNPSGEYGVGELFQIQIVFTYPVAVIEGEVLNRPTLALKTDELHLLTSSQGVATYVGGSGSDTLIFEYTAGQLDYCKDLDYMDAASLVLNGGGWAIKRNASRPTTDAILTLPAPKTTNSLSGTRTIAIKPTQPTVVQVTSPTPNGKYYPGDTILVDVMFSLPVVVFGVPVLLLATGETPARALLASGNNTAKLTFQYDVGIGDTSADLDVVDDRVGEDQAYFVMSLLLAGHAEIKRASTNPYTTAVAALSAPGLLGSLSISKNLIVDSTPSTIIDIRSPVPDGTYDIGEQIDVLLVFSRRVVVIGTPELILNVPSEYRRTAVYVDGSDTNTLRFSYFPKEGDNSRNLALDILDENALILRPLLSGKEVLQDPARILCQSAKPTLAANIMLPVPGVAVRADAVLSLVGNNRKIFVRTDGVRVKAIDSDVSSGVYSPGQRIVVSVIFTSLAVVQGVPRLKLNANTAAYATYFAGTGTTRLQFGYVVATGDSCLVLEAASRSGLELNGGVISDQEGIYIPLRLPAASKPGSLSAKYQIQITSTPPIVQRVYSKDVNDNYGVGDTLHIAVEFSRKVALQNPLVVPSLLLQFDTGARAATYASGDKTTTFVFTIQIVNGDATSSLEYTSATALTGTILALSTTPTTAANLALPVLGNTGSLSDSSAIGVISTPPTIVSVYSSSRDGTYGLNDKLRIRIRFSFPVFVSVTASPSCTLTLSVGDVGFRKAVYVGGSTTSILEFVYIVESGDHAAHLDYAEADSLQCSILQATAVPTLPTLNTLPLPGAEGSLSFASALRIDALSPRVTSVSSGLANGVYGAGQLIDIAITFSEPILLPSTATPRLRLAIASNVAVNALLTSTSEPLATYTGGSGTNVLKFAYTTQVGDMAMPLEYAGIDALSMTFAHVQVTSAGAQQKQCRFASLRLPVPGTTGSLSNNRDIHIDTLEPPRVLSVGSPMADGIYTAGDTITLSVTFSAPVTVCGQPPKLLLETGNPNSPDTTKQAVYVSGSGTSVLLFEYQVQVGDHVDRLEYTRCPLAERSTSSLRKWDKLVICSSLANALQLNGIGSSIKRTSTNPVTDAILHLPEVNEWSEVRFITPSDDFIYVTQVEPTTGIAKANLTLIPPLEYEFSISHQRKTINIYSNGFPSHDSKLQEKIVKQKYFIELQRFPTQQSQPLNLSRIADGFAGVFFNGVLFKTNNHSALRTDECGGAIDADGHYFYVGLPTCYLKAAHEPREPVPSLTAAPIQPPSVIVAYGLDGYPVYGYYDENGQLPSDLDECHGRTRLNGQYGYHLVPPETSASPFMPCLKGIDATSTLQSKLAVFRYPADISALEGLSLTELSRFESFVIDENPNSFHTAAWINVESMSVVYTSTTVIVRSTGVPLTGTYGPFPNAYNRFKVHKQDYVFQFPRRPEISATKTSLPVDTPIGVMVDGVPFFASDSVVYNGNVLNSRNAAYVLLDKCNGLVDAGGDYRYYASPDCLLKKLGDRVGQPSPLIGFAFDGFPLYGMYSENGQLPTDLDECNGRVGDDGTYRYHVTLVAPYLIGCFRGTPAITQKSLDAASDLYRSLSYAHALRINTHRPRVSHVFSNKRPGTYVAGESVDIAVQWSTPVKVDTTGGLPTLSILNSSRTATYDVSRSSKTQTVFLFTVKSDDTELEDFSYDAHVNIQLNGGRISRFATLATIDADLKLIPVDLEDTSLLRTRTAGLSSKFQLIQDLRVVLRGLYHPRAQDLRARVFHGYRQSTIFDGCCEVRDAFGIPDTPDVLTNRAQLASEARNPTSGVGWDYSFRDFDGFKNLAVDGGATALQSSTSGACEATNAIDGKIRGVSVSTQTVARTLPATKANESSWWELRLVDVSTIGTIRIWVADPNPSVQATIFTLRVDSSDGTSAVNGDFTLAFTTPNGQQKLTTKPINYNAVSMIADENKRVVTPGIGLEESIQSKLSALGGFVPRMFITREPRDGTLSRNGAFTWHITFLDNPRTDSAAESLVAPVLSVGENNVCGGTGIIKLSTPLSIYDDNDPFVYQKEATTKATATTSIRDPEQAMFPFWVLLFDSPAVMDVESFADAYNRSIFSYRVDSRQANRSIISVVPPLGTKAQYVRLVAEMPRGVLSIAEVEVFVEQNYVLSQYAGGSPVRTAYHPGGKTWSPEEPFRYVFAGMPSDGTWTLAIADMTINDSTQERSNATAGGISDWTLHVTNQAGETTSYFMDFQAQLHALPRHGTLYIALNETERDHVDVDGNGLMDSMEADTYLRRFSPNNYIDLPTLTRDRELKDFVMSYEQYGGLQVLRDPSERQLRLPSLVCDAECLAAIKLDPYFYVGLEGDKALKLLRVVGDRVVKYVPQTGFRGTDAFTFSVAVAGQESRVLGTIQLNVKECEDKDCRMASFFLHRSTR